MPYEGPTDDQLMADFYAGDDSAFVEIVRRWKDRLYRYFRGRGWSHEKAEELTQETFTHVYETKPSGRGRYDPDPERRFAPWIYRIARNVSASWYRHEQSRPRLVSEEAELPPRVPLESDKMTSNDLDDCLKTLTDEEREFLALWQDAYGELSQTEIAEVFDVANSTVTKIKDSALDKLRACMEGKGYHR